MHLRKGDRSCMLYSSSWDKQRLWRDVIHGLLHRCPVEQPPPTPLPPPQFPHLGRTGGLIGTVWLNRATKLNTPTPSAKSEHMHPTCTKKAGKDQGVEMACVWNPHFEHLHFSSGTSRRELPSHCWQVKFSVFTYTDRHSWIKTTSPTKTMGWEWGTLKPEVSVHSPVKKWLLSQYHSKNAFNVRNSAGLGRQPSSVLAKKSAEWKNKLKNIKSLRKRARLKGGLKFPFDPTVITCLLIPLMCRVSQPSPGRVEMAACPPGTSAPDRGIALALQWPTPWAEKQLTPEKKKKKSCFAGRN